MLYGFIQRALGLNSLDKAKKVVFDVVTFFSIIYFYNILRITKDALATGQAEGSLIISYMKLFMTLPFSIILFAVYDILFKRFSQERIFYGTVISFLAFFTLYVFVLSPYQSYVHLSPSSARAVELSFARLDPTIFGFHIRLFSAIGSVIAVLASQWTVACFYMMAELWGTSMIGVMFWGFMNFTTRKEDAAKIFPAPYFASATSGILVGVLNYLRRNSAASTWANTLTSVYIQLVFFGVLMIVMHYQSRRIAAKEAVLGLKEEKEVYAEKRNRPGIFNTLRMVARSPYMLLILMLVILYGTCMGLIEFVSKNFLSMIFNFNKNSLYRVNSIITAVQGIFTMGTLLLAYGLLKSRPWRTIITTTPYTLFFLGGLFFTCAFFPVIPGTIATILGLNRIAFFRNLVSNIYPNPTIIAAAAITVFLGVLQGMITKTTKYLFFDNSKERAFILLTPKERLLGKNAIDSVGSRLGKGSSGLLNTFIFIPYFGGAVGLRNFEKVLNSQYAIGVFFMVATVIMIICAWRLIPLYEARAKNITQSGSDISNSRRNNKTNSSTTGEIDGDDIDDTVYDVDDDYDSEDNSEEDIHEE